MRTWLISAIIWLLAGAAAVAETPVVGVGLVNEPYKQTPAEQEATFRALQAAGVHVIRAGIPNNDQGLAFAERAYAHGIRIEWLMGVYPDPGTKWPQLAATYKGKGFWEGWPLSTANAGLFKANIGAELARLEAKGVVLAGFELGNEINWTGFNADFPLPAQGRILSEKDLANDTEGRQIAKGYLRYIETLAVLKDLRDHSTLNRRTPIISAGLAGLDNSAGWLRSVKADAVDVVATLHFLQAHGLDRLVDGYGLHLYPMVASPGTPQGLASLRAQVENDGLPECRPTGAAKGKPCWITEWNFNGLKGLDQCPIDDSGRIAMVREMRSVFAELAKQQRLGGAIFYTWQGQIHAPKEDHNSAFLCGALTESGKLAVTPISASDDPAADTRPGALAPLEFGVDRSNMGTQWTLSWPQEPKAAPFLAADYNKPGNFEARRVAVLDGIAQVHAGWFRDGFGKGSPDLFVDLVKLVHARGMKMLAVFGAAASDYPPGAYLNKEQSGCQWGTYPLSKINLGAYQKRIEAQFAAVRAANETVEAFEIGNELDLYCNDADNPTGAEWAKHQWKWFLSPAQVQTFARGYAPYLAASVASIRKYFPQARIITYGNSMPASAPLIEALASVRGADGKLTDYTRLVDGYGSHLYPTSTTTLNMVQDATNSLRYEAAHYPHVNRTPIWITEWNPAGSSWWNGQPWYFQYDAQGRPGGDLNKADPRGVYKAMDRAGAIRAFNHDVVEALRSSPSAPVNISHVFYYAYDSGGPSPKCDHVKYSWPTSLPAGFCLDGMIDPSTGDLLSDVATAVAGER